MNGSLAPGGFLMLRSDHGRNASQSFGCEERVHAIILQFFFFLFLFPRIGYGMFTFGQKLFPVLIIERKTR